MNGSNFLTLWSLIQPASQTIQAHTRPRICQAVKLVQQQMTSHPTLLTAGCSYNAILTSSQLLPSLTRPVTAVASKIAMVAAWATNGGCFGTSEGAGVANTQFISSGTKAST